MIVFRPLEHILRIRSWQKNVKFVDCKQICVTKFELPIVAIVLNDVKHMLLHMSLKLSSLYISSISI